MAGINLSKGGRIDLSKVPNLNRVRLALGWKPNTTDTGAQFDLDSSIFICKLVGAAGSEEPKLISNDHFIFYGNKASPDGAVIHAGDDTSGAQGEVITIDLTKLEAAVDEISIIVTIHEGASRKQNFGQVRNSSINLFNDETNEHIGGYQLEDDFSMETAVQFGSLFKRPGTNVWQFKAIGAGHQLGLDQFVLGYGGTLA